MLEGVSRLCGKQEAQNNRIGQQGACDEVPAILARPDKAIRCSPMAGCGKFLFVFLLICLSWITETTGLSAPARVSRPPLWKQVDNHGIVGMAIDHFKEVVSSTRETAVPGMLGRLCSVLILHPLDTMKTRAQILSLATRRTTEVQKCSNRSPKIRMVLLHETIFV